MATPTTDKLIDWEAECRLDPDLHFDHPIASTAEEPVVILLTGATGFLGAFVLDELLRRTRARVICLVRGQSPEQGSQRLRTHLAGLRLDPPGLADRVDILLGDLAQPNLGVSSARFDELAATVDVIYHAGATIHFLAPYRALRAANVGGTKTLLRLAGTRRTKPLHYVSSLAVFFGEPHERVSEDDTPTIAGLRTGYAQSKWVAEQKVREAASRGLPTVVYRTARISGHSQTGATSNQRDMLNQLIKACIMLGAYPGMAVEFAMVPVDYGSRAIVELSRQQRSWGESFHLVNPQPLGWRELMQTIRTLGYPVVELDRGDWLARLKQRARSREHAEDDTLGRLWMALASSRTWFARRPRYDTPRSEAWLRSSGVACPPIDAEVIAKYIGFFVTTGYLPAPAQSPFG